MGKKFGQHFLSDHMVLSDIADTIFASQDGVGATKVIEVGPGQGVLTRLIIPSFDQARLLEIDMILEPHLTPIVKAHSDAKIIWGDVLESTVALDETTLVVGNLPYYITSPIFRKFFVEQSAIGGVFLIQREVALKLQTITTQKSYLRWLLNYSYDINYCFTVASTAFTPPPKVQSAVISFTKKDQESVDFDRMVRFLDVVSQYTRKTLRKIWKMREKDLASFILPPELEGMRVQQLTWEEIGRILEEK